VSSVAKYNMSRACVSNQSSTRANNRQQLCWEKFKHG